MRLTPDNPLAVRGGTITAWLAVFVLAVVVALTWFGYRATTEWQSNATQLTERQQQQVAVALNISLARDMRGVQSAVVDRHQWTTEELDSPARLAEVLAPVFRRYAYPEAFFASRLTQDPYFVARASRLPPWAREGDMASGLQWFTNADVAKLLRVRMLEDAGSRRQYSIFRIDISGTDYQVVMRFLRGAADAGAGEPMAVVGFLVNMHWAKSEYFMPMLESAMASVTSESRVVDPTGISFALLDQRGVTVGDHARIAADRRPTPRRFNAHFFDQALATTETVRDLDNWAWTLQLSAAEDPTLATALNGARRTLVMLAVGALALGIGLMIIVRATRASAAVASMRSEFVATVTHELKTPIAVIQSIGETMVRGRVGSPEQQREYAQLLVHETYRLRHLIDNLLAYARITEVADVYSFEPLQPEEVVEEAVHGFRKLLRDRGIEVSVSFPQVLPPIHGDRTSIVFALDNLLDNAMRHAGGTRIELAARAQQAVVEFVVSDSGRGISEDQMKRMQQPFVRGTSSPGSGLGLAIVRRIAAAHRGWFRLESQVDGGTSATLAIPTTG